MSETTARRSVQVTRRFDATPERVFDAWLDPAAARRFLFATETGEMVRVDIDPRIGGRFNITERRPEMGGDIEHVGEYLQIDRPRRLVFTFAVPKFSAEHTQVTIDNARVGDGCELILTHEGVLPEWADSTQQGWGMILDGLTRALQP